MGHRGLLGFCSRAGTPLRHLYRVGTWGRSCGGGGGGPTCHNTTPLQDLDAIPEGYKIPLGGLALHSPLLSGIRVLRPACTTTTCCDPFKNIRKIKGVHSPTLIIHGLRDDVVHASHGQQLHELSRNPVDPLFLPDADHNDIETFPQYMARLVSFCDELDAIRDSVLAE